MPFICFHFIVPCYISNRNNTLQFEFPTDGRCIKLEENGTIHHRNCKTIRVNRQIQRENSTTGSEIDQVNEMISISENKLASYQKNEKEIY